MGKDLFQRQININQFIGLRVVTEENEVGIIRSSFGTSGKFKVEFPGGTCAKEGSILFLKFRRYVYDFKKTIQQDLNELVLPEKALAVRLSNENILKNMNRSIYTVKNGNDNIKKHVHDDKIIISNSYN